MNSDETLDEDMQNLVKILQILLFAYPFGHTWTLPTSHPRRSLIKKT